MTDEQKAQVLRTLDGADREYEKLVSAYHRYAADKRYMAEAKAEALQGTLKAVEALKEKHGKAAMECIENIRNESRPKAVEKESPLVELAAKLELVRLGHVLTPTELKEFGNAATAFGVGSLATAMERQTQVTLWSQVIPTLDTDGMRSLWQEDVGNADLLQLLNAELTRRRSVTDNETVRNSLETLQRELNNWDAVEPDKDLQEVEKLIRVSFLQMKGSYYSKMAENWPQGVRRDVRDDCLIAEPQYFAKRLAEGRV